MNYFVLNTKRVAIIRRGIMSWQMNEVMHHFCLITSDDLAHYLHNELQMLAVKLARGGKTRVKSSQIIVRHITCLQIQELPKNEEEIIAPIDNTSPDGRMWLIRNVSHIVFLFCFLSNRVHTHTFIMGVYLSLPGALSISLAVYMEYCLFLNLLSPHTTLTSYNFTLLPT